MLLLNQLFELKNLQMNNRLCYLVPLLRIVGIANTVLMVLTIRIKQIVIKNEYMSCKINVGDQESSTFIL